jgi:transcriptional regulator with XRE-family HTH domain
METSSFGENLRNARRGAQLTQATLARAAKVSRLTVVRAEQGLLIPRFDEVVRLAEVLKVPLVYFLTARFSPSTDLRGIAFELYHLGVRDLVVSAPSNPGGFRRVEQTLVLALKGDSPEPRVVEAFPLILAGTEPEAGLTSAFADVHDPRVKTRLAWLADVTLTLKQLGSFPLEIRSERHLSQLKQAGVKSEPDAVGQWGEGPFSPVWQRWNIRYAGTVADFLKRTQQLVALMPRREPDR